jgi:hypothetical protein
MLKLLSNLLLHSSSTPQRPSGRQATRSAPAPSTATRSKSDRELAKGVLPLGPPRKWQPGEPLPAKFLQTQSASEIEVIHHLLG